MKLVTGLELKLQEMASRISELREISGLTIEQMAQKTGVSEAEYKARENGEHDISFAFIYRCAMAFGVNVTDIIEGTSPTLKDYVITRRGEGTRIAPAHGMVYYDLASSFQNRISEPLFVTCDYSKEAEDGPIELTTHAGQECDLVVRGALKLQIGSHTEILHEGDAAYFNSGIPHGMVATGGKQCIFYAIVLNPSEYKGEAYPSTEIHPAEPVPEEKHAERWIYHDFIHPKKNKDGLLSGVVFENEEKFNFAFDIVDELARRKPDKLAMLHISHDKKERRFTFADMSVASSKCANYFKSLGIKRGDRVMLVLKRNYEFWFAVLGLHKLGAIAIPATYLLQKHDYEYRFKKAGVSAVIVSADCDASQIIDQIETDAPATRIIVEGSRTGWHCFDSEFPLFSEKFARTEDAPCGKDLMLMFFTSGTTGEPKLAAHDYRYALGHFITAKYWQCVDPDGLHLTISDTGWAKAMWGKLYGQWLCEAAVFVYDFERFDASDILPMFAKYHITTFCAPPTMYRMMIREDLSKYDLSSVKRATIAGEALNPEVFRQMEKATGLKVMEGFGQSESTVMIANLRGFPHKIGSLGKPVPLYDIDLVDENGKSVGDGVNGEIVVRLDRGSPCGLVREYYNDPVYTAQVKTDTLYHTGDLAWRDEDGFFWYVGRKDDVIKSSGYRIGPFEIESVIMELPYVLECGVSAAPDEVRGQVVKASIVLTSARKPSPELVSEIQEYVKSRTAPYKYPRIVVFCDSLPKTTSGKIIRHLL
jgi:acetyl-CoA synthetase